MTVTERISLVGAKLNPFGSALNNPKNYDPGVLILPQHVAVHVSRGDSRVDGLWVSFSKIRARVVPKTSWRSNLSCLGLGGGSTNSKNPDRYAPGRVLVDVKVSADGKAYAADGQESVDRQASADQQASADAQASADGLVFGGVADSHGQAPTKLVLEPPHEDILRGISGKLRPGELLAILGGSGCGKSTFLNCLAGYPQKDIETSGSIRFGGKEVTAEQRQAICGYVQQYDLFLPYLTVREHLTSQAYLRLTRIIETNQDSEKVDRKATKQEVLHAVEKALRDFNLTKIEDSFIGEPGQGLSGGERKRLAVAVECLSKPAILICDEPTSGSDAFTAESIVVLLQRIAQKESKVVFITVHQPASHIYYSFSKVLFLANGRVAYYGKPKEATDFFGTLGYPCPARFNPADYYVNLLTIHNDRALAINASRYGGIKTSSWLEIESMCKEFQKKDATTGKEMLVIVKDEQQQVPLDEILKMYSHKPASWSRQLKVLLGRNSKCIWRHPKAYLMDLLAGVVMAIIAGLFYTNSKPTEQFEKKDIFSTNGAIWYTIILNGIFFVGKTIRHSFEEFPHILREQSRRLYSIWAFYVAKNAFDLPARILFPLISTGSLYYWIGLRWDDYFARRYSVFCAYIVAHTLANTGYAYALAALCLDEKVAGQVSHVSNLLLYTVGGGFFINKRTLPFVLSWVPYFSWYFYTSEGLYSNQWEGATFDCYEKAGNVTQLQAEGETKGFYLRASSNCPFPNGEAILAMLAMDARNVYRNLWILFIYVVVLRILGGILLNMKVQRSLKG